MTPRGWPRGDVVRALGSEYPVARPLPPSTRRMKGGVPSELDLRLRVDRSRQMKGTHIELDVAKDRRFVRDQDVTADHAAVDLGFQGLRARSHVSEQEPALLIRLGRATSDAEADFDAGSHRRHPAANAALGAHFHVSVRGSGQRDCNLPAPRFHNLVARRE
jgi:hypothetical protein